MDWTRMYSKAKNVIRPYSEMLGKGNGTTRATEKSAPPRLRERFNEMEEMRLRLRRVEKLLRVLTEDDDTLIVSRPRYPNKSDVLREHLDLIKREPLIAKWGLEPIPFEDINTVIPGLARIPLNSAVEEYPLYYHLARMIRATRIVETGTALGRSTLCWSAAAKKMATPDDNPVVVTFDRAKANHENARTNVTQAGFEHMVRFRTCRSQTGLREEEEGDFDLAFVDGDHSFAGCFLDMLLCGRLLQPNGYMIIQDAITSRIIASPEVEEAVLTFVENGWSEAAFFNTTTGLAILKMTNKWPSPDDNQLADWVAWYEKTANIYRFYYREFVESRELRDLTSVMLGQLGARRALVPGY